LEHYCSAGAPTRQARKRTGGLLCSDDATAAEALGLRPTTVHTHRQRIMRKLEVQSRTALIREAMRRGVIRFTDFGAIRPGLDGELDERKEP